MPSIKNNQTNRQFLKTPFQGIYTAQIKSFNNLTSINQNNNNNNKSVRIGYPINQQKQFSNNVYFYKTTH
jgi:hypothetical protein